MTTARELVQSRLRTARVAVSDAEARGLEVSLRAAGIAGPVEDTDMVIANTILDRALARLQENERRASASCPRCHGGMQPVKLATRKAGNFCSACRVVTPAAA